MDDPGDFPLIPIERKYVMKVERYRTRDPPPDPSPEWEPADLPTGPTPVAAHQTMRRMIRGPTRWEPERNRWWEWWEAVRGRVPGVCVPGVCQVLAAGVLPAGLIFLLMCRPGLRGRRLRARLVTPRDVRRVLWAANLPASALVGRFRL